MNVIAADERGALRTLVRRSDRAGLAQLAGHLGMLAVTGALVLQAPGLWLAPLMLLHGIVLVFLFAPLHETVHRTAFASRRLNDAVAFATGLPLLLPPTWFRAFHFAHHRHTQDPERDPELAEPKPASWLQWLRHVSGLPYWWRQTRMLFRHAAGKAADPLLPPASRATAIREARLYLAAYAAVGMLAVATASDVPLLLWIGPALLGQPFLRLYLLAEHTGCPRVPDMLANTRTTLTNRLIRRLAWNMPYHAEHHAYPALPFHALPAAHRLIAARLRVLGDGYVRVNLEVVRQLGEPPAPADGATLRRPASSVSDLDGGVAVRGPEPDR